MQPFSNITVLAMGIITSIAEISCSILPASAYVVTVIIVITMVITKAVVYVELMMIYHVSFSKSSSGYRFHLQQ